MAGATKAVKEFEVHPYVQFHASTAVQREEGEQLPFEAEDPALRQEYIEEYATNGVRVAMD